MKGGGGGGGEKREKGQIDLLVNRGSRVSNTCYEARGVTPADYITLALSTAEHRVREQSFFLPLGTVSTDPESAAPTSSSSSLSSVHDLFTRPVGHYPARCFIRALSRLRCVLHVRSIISSWKVRKPAGVDREPKCALADR